nr:uncharacterized protein LOC109192287 [Ipomoea batatas]
MAASRQRSFQTKRGGGYGHQGSIDLDKIKSASYKSSVTLLDHAVSSCDLVLLDVKDMLRSLTNVVISHVYRIANSVAHRLVREVCFLFVRRSAEVRWRKTTVSGGGKHCCNRWRAMAGPRSAKEKGLSNCDGEDDVMVEGRRSLLRCGSRMSHCGGGKRSSCCGGRKQGSCFWWWMTEGCCSDDGGGAVRLEGRVEGRW